MRAVISASWLIMTISSEPMLTGPVNLIPLTASLLDTLVGQTAAAGL